MIFAVENMAATTMLVVFLAVLYTVNACVDKESSCPSYRDAGYCDRYRDWMRTNCARSCGLCPTQAPATGCQDLNNYCSTWKQYCDSNSIYWPYMTKNCRKTCNLCTDGGTGGGGSGGTQGKKEYECDFETDFCVWANQPIDDAANWVIGVASGGPSSGANGSASYAYVDSTVNNYNAKLILPWELVLPADKMYIGAMCLHFSFQTGNGGSIKIVEDIYPSTSSKTPGQNVKATLQGSGTWVNGKVLVQVDDKRQLSIDGIVGSSGRIVIDNVYFVKGNC
ncbi:MAM and LDL-receptor class A domain-containing protein 1-like isoform X2 [Rhopilema esculentum]|uniref:MAM and LDL-receptor class A domain-containing protein 1-like isoform X2 n=1 Tax=Rhopilema esculentum TaxID=499914 RepID=UPI0031DF333E